MKMKAVVLHGPENYPNNYEVMEIDKPVCGDSEILLKNFGYHEKQEQ